MKARCAIFAALVTCVTPLWQSTAFTAPEPTTELHHEGGSRFVDHGIGARVAESRGVVATRTRDGRYLVIANAWDVGPRGYVLVTDIDTEQTQQIFCPEGVPPSAPYGSLLASNGRFYTGRGRVLLEFDPATTEWTFQGIPSPNASDYLSFTEAPDGTVWAGSTYQTTLISFDPMARTMSDHGRLDEREQYVFHLAFDDRGWIYGGIGTARGNIVAYQPTTGKRLSLIPEAERRWETCSVYPAVDGAAYGTCAGRSYRLRDGQATVIEPGLMPGRRPVGDIYWPKRSATFPDGRRVVDYNLPDGWLEIAEPEGGATRRIKLQYQPAGVTITSLGLGPKGKVYGSTAHPMRLLSLDPATGRVTDHGGIPEIGGGNLCAITRLGNWLIGAEYPHGRLWLYDVTGEWKPSGGNPRWVAEWPRDIARPRAVLVHPDGEHVLMGGFADYGLCGGGIGIYNIATGKTQLLTADDHLLAGHSPIALAALRDGSVIAGTSVIAPGGGHPTASEAALLVLDWPARRLTFHTVPVPGSRNIVSLAVDGAGLVHGLTGEATYFVFDPASRQILHRESFAAYGSVPRQALQRSPSGSMYAILGGAILSLGGPDFGHSLLDRAPVTITAGGALAAGRLYFAVDAHIWSYELPGARVLLPWVSQVSVEP